MSLLKVFLAVGDGLTIRPTSRTRRRAPSASDPHSPSRSRRAPSSFWDILMFKPQRFQFFATGPTPQIRLKGAVRESPDSARSTQAGRQFLPALAILATILTGAIPTETGSDKTFGSCCEGLLPLVSTHKRVLPVRSIKASSSDTRSTTGEKSLKI